MSDEIMTRNSAGELELRTVQTTGDTGNDKNDVLTRDSQGRLCVRTTGSGGGSGGKNYDAEIEALDNAVSVLSTSVDLSTEIGDKTTVALADLSAMDIDGRPSYKQAGATVYAENGVVGIIDSVDSTNAVITTVSTSASVSKGHTWTRLVSSGASDYTPANLIANFGNLSDGWYEVLVKQVRSDGELGTAWRLLFVVENGEIRYDSQKTYYIPAPELAQSSTYYGWATKDYRGYPVFLAKIDGDFVFSGFGGYPNTTPGSVDQNLYRAIFDVSDVLNLDTGEYMGLKNTRVFESYTYEPEFEGFQSYVGTTPYGVEIHIPSNQTGGSGSYEEAPVYGLWVSQPFEFGRQDSAEYLSYGHSPKCIFYIYLAFSDMSSLTILKIQLFMGEWSVETVKATGVFTNIIWDCRVKGVSDFCLYPNNIITIPDGLSLRMGYCFCGSSGTLPYIQYILYDDRSEYTPRLQLNALPRQVPTASSSAYTLYHENGLVEMGGIVPITDTMQPNVAFGNIPVVFPQELANANFVPTITVMTDGTFKQVMADVANPTTTGFDLCVRNVDTEAVSNIKIAWKIVGTRK